MYEHTDPVALWAEAQITALDAGDLPRYGSRAWAELPADDPRRVGAILTAAEQWRRQQREHRRLDALMEEDPEVWYAETFADARKQAARLVPAIAAMRTARDVKNLRAKGSPVRELRATAGWPPVAIPGQPGRHLVYGQPDGTSGNSQEIAA